MIFDGWLVVVTYAYFSFQPYIIFFQQVYNWPQSATTIFAEVLPDWDPKDSTFLTTSMPSTTDPNTQYLPSNQDVFAVHKKNCEPLVLGPALAIERIPGPVCFKLKFSSSNFMP